MNESIILLRSVIEETLKHRNVVKFINAWNSNPLLRISSVEIIPSYTDENLYVDFQFNYQTVDKITDEKVLISVAWNSDNGYQVLKGECNIRSDAIKKT
jgi:hypothetical protein